MDLLSREMMTSGSFCLFDCLGPVLPGPKRDVCIRHWNFRRLEQRSQNPGSAHTWSFTLRSWPGSCSPINTGVILVGAAWSLRRCNSPHFQCCRNVSEQKFSLCAYMPSWKMMLPAILSCAVMCQNQNGVVPLIPKKCLFVCIYFLDKYCLACCPSCVCRAVHCCTQKASIQIPKSGTNTFVSALIYIMCLFASSDDVWVCFHRF